jgi:hypothetical protein
MRVAEQITGLCRISRRSLDIVSCKREDQQGTEELAKCSVLTLATQKHG